MSSPVPTPGGLVFDDAPAPASAELSPCGRYRYYLSRSWSFGVHRRVLFIMLNPSTADGRLDDATIRQCRRLAQYWGFGGLDVVNLYAWRSTDPRQLLQVADPVGPDNDERIRRALQAADEVLVAWGANAGADRADQVRLLLAGCGKPVQCLGLTRSGTPRHPLYLALKHPRQPFT